MMSPKLAINTHDTYVVARVRIAGGTGGSNEFQTCFRHKKRPRWSFRIRFTRNLPETHYVRTWSCKRGSRYGCTGFQVDFNYIMNVRKRFSSTCFSSQMPTDLYVIYFFWENIPYDWLSLLPPLEFQGFFKKVSERFQRGFQNFNMAFMYCILRLNVCNWISATKR